MKKSIQRLSSYSRNSKQLILMSLDAIVLPILLALCYKIRLWDITAPVLDGLDYWYLFFPIFTVAVLYGFGIYQAVVRSFDERLLGLLTASVTVIFIFLYVLRLLHIAAVPMSIPFMFAVLMFSWVWFTRSMIRFLVIYSYQTHELKKRVGIYGAGHAGQQLLAVLNRTQQYAAVILIDDNVNLTNQMVSGLKVYSIHQCLQQADKHKLDEIILAIPSLTRTRRRQIVKRLEPLHIPVKILPSFVELLDGQVKISEIRDIDILDLLGRDSVPPIQTLLEKNIRNKVVLVTGAGGSIGSELCRQILKNQPKHLILFEISEFALYAIEHELKQNSAIRITPVLGSVLNQDRLLQMMQLHQVQTIYHAAAYKHVPLVESNPFEGIMNNSVGTARCAKAALQAGIETFVLISTDKAVRPTNVMGASKRLSELVCQALAASHTQKTCFSMVRFGNVLGSSGSVVPLFKKQIADGGPITVTHPDVTRYFMTIPEAAQLVIQAGAMACGGDVFLLDMGQPVRIYDLACQMISLSGLSIKDEQNPDGDIEIKYSGLRPGEKLYEELLIDSKNGEGTEHTLIVRAQEKQYSLAEIEGFLEKVVEYAVDMRELDWILGQLEYFVDGYRRSETFTLTDVPKVAS